MKAFNPPNIHSQKGFAVIYSLVLVILAAIIGYILSKSMVESRERSQQNIDENTVAVLISAAAETFLPALDLAESRYMEYVSSCDKTVSFLEAIVNGHHCASAGSIQIFSSDDVSLLTPAEQTLFQYLGSWSISQNSVSPVSSNGVVRIPLDAPYAVEFYLDGTIPEGSWLIMNAILLKNGTQVINRKVSFALKTQDYRIHLESSTSLISQEIQNPENPCLNEPWNEFSTFTNGTCSPLQHMGIVTGITRFKERYFGLNNLDGSIYDLTIPEPADNLVNENGTVGGKAVFIPYRKDNLAGADDIEVIDEDSGNPQIYYVRGTGLGVHIGYSDYASNANYSVCNLGAMGWAQSYSALGASSGSTQLIPKNTNASMSIAHFTLKTDTGYLLNVTIRSQKSGGRYNPSLPPASIITDGTLKRTFICTVEKENTPPLPEFQRTLGMTQSVSTRKRFSLL